MQRPSAQRQSCALGHGQDQQSHRRNLFQKLRMKTVKRWGRLKHFSRAQKYSWTWVYQAARLLAVTGLQEPFWKESSWSPASCALRSRC